MKTFITNFLKLNKSKMNLIILSWFMGFIGGFTIMITGSTLNFWLTTIEVDIIEIGLFALVMIPFSINFLLMPIFDSTSPPILSKIFPKHVGWMFVFSSLTSIFMIFMSFVNIKTNMILFASFAFCVSLFISTKDAMISAIRLDIFSKEEQKSFSGIYIFGYRIGMVLSGFVPIYLSSFVSFEVIYRFIGSVIFLFPIILYHLLNKFSLINKLIQNTNNPSNTNSNIDINLNSSLSTDYQKLSKSKNLTWKRFLSEIFSPIGNLKIITLIIIFLLIYRLSDNLISVIINPFFLNHIGYSSSEIAFMGKLFGVFNAILGGIIAGYIMKNRPITSSLIIFGIIHALAHLVFIVQNIYGKNIYLYGFVTFIESLTGGMTMASFITFIGLLCRGKFKATQYAFLSSTMGFSRAIFPTLSGYLVTFYGYNIFFMLSTIFIIPSIILILIIRKYKKI